MLRWMTGLGAVVVAAAAAGCGSGSSGGSVAVPQSEPSSSAPAESSTSDTIAGVAANDHGTKDVSGMRTFTIEADNYYFDPSVLKGTPGQKLTLVIENTSSTQHNFSVKEQNINSDLDSKAKVTTHVTFPSSGVLSFFCEYHKSEGMAGGLLTSGGKASTSTSTTSPSSSSGGGGGYGWG